MEVIVKRNGLVSFMVFAFVFGVNADVPPPQDQMRVTADLIIETNEDWSDYRFFAGFFGAHYEFEVKSKTQTIIPPPDGGARFIAATILAIPGSNLKDFPDKLVSPYDPKGKLLSDAIEGEKIAGIVELGKHQFSRYIKTSERMNWTYPIYRLERDGNNLKFSKIKDVAPQISPDEEKKMKGGKVDFTLEPVKLTPLYYIALIGFPTAATIIFGIWFFRRKGRKLD